MKARSPVEKKESPGGLISFTRERVDTELEETAPETYNITATDPVVFIQSMITGMREVAHHTITAVGQSPAKWEQILHEGEEANLAYVAAKLLRELELVERHLSAFEETGSHFDAISAVQMALAAGWTFEALGIVENEVGILARAKSQEGARIGSQQRTKAIAGRDEDLARTYLERRPTTRMTDTALKEALAAASA